MQKMLLALLLALLLAAAPPGQALGTLGAFESALSTHRPPARHVSAADLGAGEGSAEASNRRTHWLDDLWRRAEGLLTPAQVRGNVWGGVPAGAGRSTGAGRQLLSRTPGWGLPSGAALSTPRDHRMRSRFAP